MTTQQHSNTVTQQHKIGWLNLPGYKGETWNPIAGCKKVSPGCENCYAEQMANRLAGMALKKDSTLAVAKYAMVTSNGKWNGLSLFNQPELAKPLEWKSPRVVFVCSMGDLFFEKHSFEYINAIFSVMADCDQHIYIVLTKRPEQMLKFYAWKQQQYGIPWRPKDNIWVGVSAENQEQANKRLPVLLKVPAAVRFVSIEPMLGPVDLTSFTHSHSHAFTHSLDWVICGGESGHKARPMHPDWVHSVRDQCKAAGVPFFLKQWGEWLPIGQFSSEKAKVKSWIPFSGTEVMRVGRKAAGNLLDGEKWEQYPEMV